MKTHSEVNFEKRGKLEDHQTCPVCQCCTCDGHTHAKVRTIFTFCLLTLVLLLLPTLSLAAEVNYDFQTLDISVPGHPGLIAFPEDIGDSGKILSNIRDGDTTETIIFGKVNRRGIRRQLARFGCSDVPFFDTIGESINRRGDVVGSCIVSGKQVGFIRFQGGFLLLLDFPGADGSSARGLSNDGRITGQFFGPIDPARGGTLSYRFHCFTFNQATNSFTQIDFIAPSTFVDCLAVTNQGRVLVRYIIVNEINETIQAGFAILDNGSWSFPFPLDLSAFGGPSVFVADLNNQGQAIVERTTGLQLFDDGVFFDIDTPDDWLNIAVGGMNNKGEFVGAYSIQVGVTPGPPPLGGRPILERHGFLATPADKAAKMAKK